MVMALSNAANDVTVTAIMQLDLENVSFRGDITETFGGNRCTCTSCWFCPSFRCKTCRCIKVKLLLMVAEQACN